MLELLNKRETKIQIFLDPITDFRFGEWNGNIQKGLKIRKGKNLDVIL